MCLKNITVNNVHIDEKIVQFLRSKEFEHKKSDIFSYHKLENKNGWTIYVEEMASNNSPEILVFTDKTGLYSQIEKANLQALKYVLG